MARGRKPTSEAMKYRNGKKCYDIKDLSRLMNVSVRTVERRIQSGQVPPPIDGAVSGLPSMWDRATIDAWLGVEAPAPADPYEAASQREKQSRDWLRGAIRRRVERKNPGALDTVELYASLFSDAELAELRDIG